MKRLIPLALTAFVFAATSPAAQPDLAIKVEPERAAVRFGDPISLRLTFRNQSANAFRLPDTVTPPTYQLWVLKLRDANTKKTFTGVSALPMGAAPTAGSIKPQLLVPEAAVSVTVSFNSFIFLEGDLSFEEARNIYFPKRQKPRSEFTLPVGAYALSVIVHFPRYPDRPNLPSDVQSAVVAIQNDPVPLWKGSEARSDEIQIAIHDDARR